MSSEYATKAGVEAQVVEQRVGDMIRTLPQHMVYKALDSMFREWMAAQKKSAR